MYHGDFEKSGIIYLYFNTVGTTGEAASLSSGTITAYEDGSATQFTSGITLDNDFDSVTGFHQIAIDLDDANFEEGKTYTLILSAGTVGALSVVGRIAASFSCGRYASASDVQDGLATAAALSTVNDTVDNIDADVTTLGTRIPAALVSGRMDVSVGAMATNVITAAATAADYLAEIDTQVDTALTNYGAVQPTVSGRTLDISSGGNAGIDWANISGNTTTVNLSGTTVKTVTDVETDTADIQARLPAALVSGRIDASVGAMAANTITAAALATDAGTEIGDAVVATVLSEPTAVPAANGTLAQKLGWVFAYFRNRVTVTASARTLYADDGTTALSAEVLSDNDTTFEKGEAP